jgi:hypothetical protein
MSVVTSVIAGARRYGDYPYTGYLTPSTCVEELEGEEVVPWVEEEATPLGHMPAKDSTIPVVCGVLVSKGTVELVRDPRTGLPTNPRMLFSLMDYGCEWQS